MIEYKGFRPSHIGWISTSKPTVHSGLRRRFYGNRPRSGPNIGLTMGFYVVWRRFMILYEKKSKSVNFDVCQAQKPKFLDFPKNDHKWLLRALGTQIGQTAGQETAVTME